ncbi:MAG: SAF domain-containing protein [Lachnospiraceae bacterium]|nr:SAF domain-containing protein [Lachnospiraceae bacterium]
MKKDRSNKRGIRYGLFASAIIMSAGVFAVMTYLQKQALSDYEKKEVYVAANDIPRGCVITNENLSEYMVLKSIEAGCVTDRSLTTAGEVCGLSPVYDISAGTILTGSMFTSSTEEMNRMDAPVLAGFRTDDLSRAVSGVLRAGDRIDIYCSDPVSGEGRLLCENVYVESGYDSSGNAVRDPSVAVMFNVYLESEQAESFYEGLMSGSLYVVRRC